jgi:hypothetical protein
MFLLPAQLARRRRGYARETFDKPLPLSTERRPDLFRQFLNHGIIDETTTTPLSRRLAGRDRAAGRPRLSS